jgi:hypothetical protein
MVFRSDFLESDSPLRQRAHRAGRVCAVVLGCVGALAVLVEWQREAALARVAQGLLADAKPVSQPAAEEPGDTGHGRPQFRHSVVMGGVYDRADVAQAVRTDAVVDAHYRDIDVQNLEPDVVSAPRQAYVSYRIGHRVYWTRKPVTIRAGETVLSDGVSAIRARCGNRISDAPMEPTSAVEPAEGELDEPLEPAPITRTQNPVALAMPRVVPFFPGVGDTFPELGGYPFPVGGTPQAFLPMGLDDSNPDEFSFPGGPGGGTPGGRGNPPGGENPPGGGNPPGDNPPGGNPPGGNPPGDNPPGGNPPGGDPPWDPPCCVTPTIDPPSDEPPPSVPEPGPLALLAVGFAAVAAQRLLQRHED